jgi:Necrosis inducing protein (NPP1)
MASDGGPVLALSQGCELNDRSVSDHPSTLDQEPASIWVVLLTAHDGAPRGEGRNRRGSRWLWLTIRAFAVGVALVFAFPGVARADPPGALDWAAPWADRTYEPAFDYDKDGCYPTPAIGQDGTIAPGLWLGGARNGHCRDAWDLDNANAYSRVKCNNGWCAYMYALYFEKDQDSWLISGHRHDWEHVVVWVREGLATYVSTSDLDGYVIRDRNQVPWDDTGTHPKVIYHQVSMDKHVFRHANFGEEPENHKGAWQFPPLIGWESYPPGFRDRLASHNFGTPKFGLKDGTFESELAKAKPRSIQFDPRG